MENINITLENPQVNNVNSILSGPQGEPGFSPIANVSKTGNTTTITITDEQGTTTAQVLDGTDGADGTPNTLTVGSVVSGEYASATITGTTPNQVLNLVLPQGEQGEAGDDGVSPTITIGTTHTVSPSTPASVTNVGSDTNIVLNFDIPQGVQGDDSNCLSLPTIVSELPEVGDPKTFYFVPKSYTKTTATGDNLTLTFTDTGAISDFTIKGYLNSLTPLSGNITIAVDSDTYTIPLDSTYLAEVNGTYDEITYTGTGWNLIRRIGYISSYNGETITTDYVSTSGTLTTGDEVYYVLEDEETIEISDDNITDPLNAIVTTAYAVGTTTITTTANVTANLELKYYSYDVNNQYDKYVYIIDTSNYEQIG